VASTVAAAERVCPLILIAVVVIILLALGFYLRLTPLGRGDRFVAFPLR